jgi:DNA-binding transcriptional regulator YhcF (GntR family)
MLQVNTNTIQRSYQELERQGLIGSKRGTGYFFTEDVGMTEKTRRELARDSLRRFVEEMRSLGCKDSEILEELTSYVQTEGVEQKVD